MANQAIEEVSDCRTHSEIKNEPSKLHKDADLADPSSRLTNRQSEIQLPPGFPSGTELSCLHKNEQERQDAKDLDEAKRTLAELPNRLRETALKTNSMKVMNTSMPVETLEGDEVNMPAHASALKPAEKYIYDGLKKAGLNPTFEKSVTANDREVWAINANWK